MGSMPAPRRFTATMPARARPSRRRRALHVALFVLALLALTRLAWWVMRVPSDPVRAERVIPVR
jgi:ferric-dicitrate binding protein FerR (iron transport regulator)